MRLAVIGFGGVGKAFLKLLNDKKEELLEEDIDLKVNYILSSRGGIYNPKGINTMEFLNNSTTFSKDIIFDTILKNRDVDMVVEMTPTNMEDGEPGMTHITKSLENGFHVVTANKGPILLAYKRLKEIAAKNNVQLGIGCTTGGALPTVNGGIIDLAGSKILSIEGVLNGTSNFILNEMESKGVEYMEALKMAQKLGIAETNPSLDVDGWDTATKLLILTNVLMNQNKTMNDVKVEGITSITSADIKEAAKNGLKYKLIGRTIKKEKDLEISVSLQKIDTDNHLYGVEGKNKAVRYVSDTLGDLTIIGGASGVTPAAASILRDIVNICRGYKFIQ